MIIRYTLAIVFALLLSSCSIFHAYRPSIQQGNVVSNAKAAQLHNGMSSQQVKNLMGDPILQNTFNDARIVYVYTLVPNRGKHTNRRIYLTFNGNRLVGIQKYLQDPLPSS